MALCKVQFCKLCFYLPTASKRAILTLVYHARLFLLKVWMCVSLPYKDSLRKYSLIFQCKPNSTHKVYIKSMLTVIGERREFFQSLKQNLYHTIPRNHIMKSIFTFVCILLPYKRNQCQINTCYESILSVYIKTYFSF